MIKNIQKYCFDLGQQDVLMWLALGSKTQSFTSFVGPELRTGIPLRMDTK
jgi:hypothetical protein